MAGTDYKGLIQSSEVMYKKFSFQELVCICGEPQRGSTFGFQEFFSERRRLKA